MHVKKKALVAAVSVAMMGGVGVAHAGMFINVPPAGAAFANEIFGPGSAATILPTVPAPAQYTMDSGPASDFIVTYTLGGGATWGTALTNGSLVFTDAGTASTVTIALVSGGGAGDSTAEFRVTVTTAVTAGDIFTLLYDINDATTLATAGNNVTLGVTLTDNLGAVDTPESVNAFTSANGTTETVTASSQAGTVLIDVATGSTEFTGSSPDVVSATEVILGSVNLANTGAAVEDDGATPWAVNVNDAGGNVTVTVIGNFNASLGVDQDSNPATADGVYLDLSGNGSFNAGEQATTLTASTATFELGAQTAFAANVHMVVDGTTAIGEQTPAATLAVDWTNATYADESATGNLRQLEKNGTTRRAWNIPSNTSPSGDRAFIRVHNTSSLSGVVRGTLTAEDGTVLLSNVELFSTPMDPNETRILSTQDLFDLGAPTWAGRAKLVVDAELPSMEVQALIRSPSGTITNLSSIAKEE